MKIKNTIKFLFSRRAQHIKAIEQEEAKQFRQQYEQNSSSHSLINDLYKLLRWKLLGLGITTISGVFLYQIMKTIEIQQINGNLRILPIKQEYDIKLANSAINTINIEEQTMQNQELELKVQPHKLILLDREYPIFQLFPHNYILSNKQFLQQLTDKQAQQLISICQYHNTQRTYINNLDLTYIPLLTYFRMRNFVASKDILTFKANILTKQIFFLQVLQEQEIQNKEISILLDKYRNIPQGKYSFINQHPYL